MGVETARRNYLITCSSSIDVLARIHSLSSNEQLVALNMAVRVTEHDTSKRGSTSLVVDNLLHETPYVSMALPIINSSKLSNTLSVVGECLQRELVVGRGGKKE